MTTKFFILYLGVLFFSSVTIGQSLEKILKEHLEAHKQEFWEQINTITADVEWDSERGTFFAEFLAKKPDLIKVISRKDRFIEACDKQGYWTLAAWTDEETQVMDYTSSMMLQYLIDFGTPLAAFTDLELKGKVAVDSKPCYWVELKEEERREEFFIEIKTGLLYKTIITQKQEEETLTLARTVYKYRTFNGIHFPTVISLKTHDRESQYVFDGIVLGEGIPTSKFSRPDEL